MLLLNLSSSVVKAQCSLDVSVHTNFYAGSPYFEEVFDKQPLPGCSNLKVIFKISLLGPVSQQFIEPYFEFEKNFDSVIPIDNDYNFSYDEITGSVIGLIDLPEVGEGDYVEVTSVFEFQMDQSWSGHNYVRNASYFCQEDGPF
ncbi:MAG TPA: hypothetical protein ENK91_03945 [Bacteroidetes bacterium]|nr:hypothetical protein [Bacteroidota bacterium]